MEKNSKSGLPVLFSNWTTWSRFMITCVSLFVLVVFSIKILLGKDASIRFRFTRQGAIIIEKERKADKGLFLLSASTLWVNTGVKLIPNQRVTIGASGKATFAIHRLVNDAIKDSLPSHPWIGPDGRRKDSTNQKKTQLDKIRKKLLLEPKVGYGTLLAVIVPDGEADPGKSNPRPEGMKVIGVCQSIVNNFKEEGTLWLTVNEGMLTSESEAEYVTDQGVLDETYGIRSDGTSKVTVAMVKERWKFIAKEEYWDIWWDDNVGYYLIQLDFNPDDENEKDWIL